MKKITLLFVSAALCNIVVATSSCGKSENNADKAKADSVVEAPVQEGALNIRYVDDEKLMTDLNIAKDYTESVQRAQSKLLSAQNARENDIRQLAAQIENKMKNNGYTSEAEYNSDMARMQKKQQDAQSYLGNLQTTTMNELEQMQMALSDSITNYIEELAKSKGYDVVLHKSAGFYIKESYDITKTVIDGINAKYTKVSK